jgi:hypothetical protein
MLNISAASNSTLHQPIQTCCVWCGRAFIRRSTGGSKQRFCCTAHRQAFWIAARRWTMRAIETGLLSIECLKGRALSVHAPGEVFRTGTHRQI